MYSLLSSFSLFTDGSGIKPDVLIAELSTSQDETFLPGDLLRGGEKRQQARGWFLEKKTKSPIKFVITKFTRSGRASQGPSWR